MKTFNRRKIMQLRAQDRLQREMLYMSHLRHPNIVQLSVYLPFDTPLLTLMLMPDRYDVQDTPAGANPVCHDFSSIAD